MVGEGRSSTRDVTKDCEERSSGGVFRVDDEIGLLGWIVNRGSSGRIVRLNL